jgi:hypothetical protein
MARKKHISSTQIHGVESLLLSKYLEWGSQQPLDVCTYQSWMDFCESVVTKEWPDPKEREPVLNALRSGYLFDFLELYLHILKSNLQEDENHE